jgi:hypothetical protein
MNEERYPKNVLDQILHWGTQTVGIAKNVKDYDETGLTITPSGDEVRFLADKLQATSQAVWDATVHECGKATSFHELLNHYSVRILALAADHISETTLRVAPDALASLKSTVDEAIQKCATPVDNKSEGILCLLGKNLVGYLENHDDQYPNALGQMEEIRRDRCFTVDYAWVSQHIKYTGAGKSCKTNPPDMIIAYDLMMLTERNGTYVLYNDAHVEYISNQRAIALGLKPF